MAPPNNVVINKRNTMFDLLNCIVLYDFLFFIKYSDEKLYFKTNL